MNIFFCDPITATVASLVSNELLARSQNNHSFDDAIGFEDRGFAAYCILSEACHGDETHSAEVITELRRQFPDEADEAAQSYFEWVHDI